LRFGVIWCIIKYRYPREAFNELEEDGCTVTERTKGVWEIAGPKVIFPFQIVDVGNLGDEWAVLKVLVPGAAEENILKVQDEHDNTKDPIHKQHLADVLRTSAESNPETYTRLRREGKMSEAVNLIFADKIEEAAEKKEEQVVARMLQKNEPVDKIVEYLNWKPEKVIAFAKKIGITSLAL